MRRTLVLIVFLECAHRTDHIHIYWYIQYRYFEADISLIGTFCAIYITIAGWDL